MKPGDISGPIETGRDGVVLQLLEKQEPSPAEFEQAKEGLREQVLQRKQNVAFQLFASTLFDRLQKENKIRRNEQEWKRLTGEEAGS
jgi:peptidyl-prolyl cis-trans isomerase D